MRKLKVWRELNKHLVKSSSQNFITDYLIRNEISTGSDLASIGNKFKPLSESDNNSD